MNIILYSDSEQISTQDIPESALALWLAHFQEESHMKAEIVRKIFDLYLQGDGVRKIKEKFQ